MPQVSAGKHDQPLSLPQLLEITASPEDVSENLSYNSQLPGHDRSHFLFNRNIECINTFLLLG